MLYILPNSYVFIFIITLLDEPEEDVKELILFQNRQLTILKYYFINI